MVHGCSLVTWRGEITDIIRMSQLHCRKRHLAHLPPLPLLSHICFVNFGWFIAPLANEVRHEEESGFSKAEHDSCDTFILSKNPAFTRFTYAEAKKKNSLKYLLYLQVHQFVQVLQQYPVKWNMTYKIRNMTLKCSMKEIFSRGTS